MSDTPVEMETTKPLVEPTIAEWKECEVVKPSKETNRPASAPAAKKGRKKTIPPSFRIEKGTFKITFP